VAEGRISRGHVIASHAIKFKPENSIAPKLNAIGGARRRDFHGLDASFLGSLSTAPQLLHARRCVGSIRFAPGQT
jgi:hypothetical protein